MKKVKTFMKYAITIVSTFIVFLILKNFVANIGGMPERFTKVYGESIFIQKGIFNVSITLYMIAIFIHLIYVYRKNQEHSRIPPRIRGLVFGLSYGVLWFFGFLELITIYDSNIGTHIGSGIRDLVSLTFFGVVVGLLFSENKVPSKKESLLVIPIVSVFFGIAHAVQYQLTFSGINQAIENGLDLIWLISTGGWIGVMYFLFSADRKSFLSKTSYFTFIIFGINWVMYTSFYILFLSIPITDLLVRCACDLAGVFFGVLVYETIMIRRKKVTTAST